MKPKDKQTLQTLLEKENTELIQENEEMKKDLGCETCQIHLEFTKLNQKIIELEKENTELKLKLEALEGETPWKDIKDKSEVIGQLTKAKKIIKEFIELCQYPTWFLSKPKIIEKAEAFINNRG